MDNTTNTAPISIIISTWFDATSSNSYSEKQRFWAILMDITDRLDDAWREWVK